MSVDDIDPATFNKAGDTANTQHAKGITDRGMKKILSGQKLEPVLPLVGWSQRDKNFVSPTA
jgi:hypothetical protein